MSGHAFAGGLLLALCCDYRVMNAERGYACMNEVHFSGKEGVVPGQFESDARADTKLMAVLRNR